MLCPSDGSSSLATRRQLWSQHGRRTESGWTAASGEDHQPILLRLTRPLPLHHSNNSCRSSRRSRRRRRRRSSSSSNNINNNDNSNSSHNNNGNNNRNSRLQFRPFSLVRPANLLRRQPPPRPTRGAASTASCLRARKPKSTISTGEKRRSKSGC